MLGHVPPAFASSVGHWAAYLSRHFWSLIARAAVSPVTANFASALCGCRACFAASVFLPC